MDGETFDSNIDTTFHHKQPFTLPLGMGRVIPGWDEGLALLKKGSKATLYIPSPLAYGPQSPSPKIAPNSILIFEVEVTDIKDAPQPPAGKQH
jgi:FKBP-type peptidyl-prolyl cis-trans isomerase